MYQAKDYTYLIGLEGFSEALLKNHFGLYEGYVKNTNTLIEKLSSLEPGTPEYAELKRRFGWEWNGMRLHELYFGNMTKRETLNTKHQASEKKMQEVLSKSFGSFEKWREDFIGTGAMRGIGWVILAHDEESGKMFNTWIDEHNTGHLTDVEPLLVMDVFEHAFMLDYGMKRSEYIEAFMNAIDWNVVKERRD
jgi:Fe-Mn family superoxide dismutase